MKTYIILFLLLVGFKSHSQLSNNWGITENDQDKLEIWRVFKKDTTKGFVEFYKREGPNYAECTIFSDSLRMWTTLGQCDLGGGMVCGVLHYGFVYKREIRKIEYIDTIVIETKGPKYTKCCKYDIKEIKRKLDLNKYYNLIEESKFQKD